MRGDSGNPMVTSASGGPLALAGRSNTGTQTAPGAGTVIASLSTQPVGLHDVEVTIGLTGTAETQLTNCQLRLGGVNVTTLPSLPGVNKYRLRVNVAVSGTLDVIAVAAATGGAIYTVSIQTQQIVS